MSGLMRGGGGGSRRDEALCIRRAHLDRLQEVRDKKESLQRVGSRHCHDDGLLRVEVGLLATEADVQVQVRPEGRRQEESKYIGKKH